MELTREALPADVAKGAPRVVRDVPFVRLRHLQRVPSLIPQSLGDPDSLFDRFDDESHLSPIPHPPFGIDATLNRSLEFADPFRCLSSVTLSSSPVGFARITTTDQQRHIAS